MADPAPEAAEVVEIPVEVDAATLHFLEREYPGAAEIPVEVDAETYAYL